MSESGADQEMEPVGAARDEPGSGRRLEIPVLSLILLCGASGSGKSLFASRHFLATEVVSSDKCRAMVGDDETDQSVTAEAFELLRAIVSTRLKLGRLTVVDATNVKRQDRAELLALAGHHDVLAAAIVFDLPLSVCLERNAGRTDRRTPDHAVRRQHQQLRRGRSMNKERFTRVHTLHSPEEVDSVSIERTRLWNDRTEDTGPFDLIGDVHGCQSELVSLLAALGYDTAADPITHPEGRRAVFVGDLVDRGPAVPAVLRLVKAMVDAGTALCVLGNHEQKLVRALAGRKVKVAHGLAESLAQLAAEPDDFVAEMAAWMDAMIGHYVLDGGRLVVAHAGLPEHYHGRTSGRVRSHALYGDTTGETDDFGLPVRYPWADDYRGKAAVVYGHTPVPSAEWVNNTICLDTGCVFGGDLTALRWPERELVSVPAEQTYFEPSRPLVSGAVTTRPIGMLDMADVAGTRFVETGLAGRVSIDGERAPAALEVMARFAADPRWLVYLPPTMSPVESSGRPELLEHPDEVFAYYQGRGVDRVVCEEKHMGSRGVVILGRSADALGSRFGITNDYAGTVLTRTGRPFFAGAGLVDHEAELITRLRAGVTEAGLWDELETDWLVLDTEVLPWSAKAGDLLTEHYAPVGAAGRSLLRAAEEATAQAVTRGVDLGELPDIVARRRAHLGRYADAYRPYCWEVAGVDDLAVAPFQILAGEGEVYARRPHPWHLEMIDRLVAAGPQVYQRTDRRFVDLADEVTKAEATRWWTDLTAGGGEGMVVKPVDTIVGERRRLVQPGVKCRGPEYLRIIYGPEYLEPANLDRLRARSLGHKRSMAGRELALGIEALDRFVAGEPLHRVHECVFAVLALESEPVDPRL